MASRGSASEGAVEGVAPPVSAERHPVTLAFRDRALEARFLEDYTRANLGHFRLCHWLTILFYGVYVAIDVSYVPTDARAMLYIGFGVVTPTFLAGYLFSYARAYRAHWALIHAGYVVIAGFGALGLTALSPPAQRFYVLTGFVFTYLFGYAVIRLRFVHASVAGAVLTVAFLALVRRLFGADPLGVALVSYYVVGINALGMMNAYWLELQNRRAYHARLLLDEEHLRVATINAELERRVAERTRELAERNRSLEQAIARHEQLAKEKASLEERFRQAQRLESVGRLAGGVAHDFNNLLTVINSYAGFIAADLPEDHPVRADVEPILEAGERAAGLTKQLLAFSRKQVLKPQIVELNAVIVEMGRMLKRLIGEDIELRTELAVDLGPIRADSGQLEQVIMNLVVNARDAMPRGGRLALETANVELDEAAAKIHAETAAGSYVMLSVSDSGTGIDEETQARVFEPFYSTKKKGQGTGLGLATVYGIVKQSGGTIWVESVLGEGTTFKILLPRVELELVEGASGPVTVELSGDETVLVVEDEPGVRRLARRILRSAGYTVHLARDGEEALRVHEQQPGIQLVLTDVVMPKMGGKQLAERLAAAGASARVLFMSGYTDDAIARQGELEPGTHLVDKPFGAAELLRAVRMALEEERKP